MNGYSSYTSIIFVAFGILYGAGFLIAAWLLVRRLMVKQDQVDHSTTVKGANDTQGRIGPEVAAPAFVPVAPVKSKESSNKKEIEPPIEIDSGFDGGGIDGGGI